MYSFGINGLKLRGDEGVKGSIAKKRQDRA